MKVLFVVLTVVGVVLLAACGSDSKLSGETSGAAASGPQQGPPLSSLPNALEAIEELTADEQAYLDRIANLVEEPDQDVRGRTFDTLGKLFPNWAPEDIQQVVVINEYRKEAKAVRARIYSDIELLKSIEPPARFDVDH